MPHRLVCILLVILTGLCAQAHATWSILIVDTRTGEIAIASATCVERINLQRETPVLITGVGAVTAQSAVDSSGRNRLIIRDRLLEGVPLVDILDELSTADSGHSNRQYGMIDITGDALTYSGPDNADWAGGQTGRIEMGEPGPADDLVYSVQGNILTGPNVVQAAVDAIINTDGDLADRLMGAMLAARFDGGDGRCSCNISAPTSCGPVPPGDFKSAHVGYMLIARADDMDAARARYNISGRANGFAFPDLDNNGIADIACSWSTGTEIKLFENPTRPGSPLTFARQSGGIEVGVAGQLDLSSCDLNNDGHMDLALIASNPNAVVAVLSDGAGGYRPPVQADLNGAPTGFAAGDLDNDGTDELVVSIGATNEIHAVALNLAGNGLTIIATTSVGGSLRGIALGHFDGDSFLDIAATQRVDDTVWVGSGDGAGGFALAQLIADHNQPAAVQSADLNHDGRDDLAVVSDTGATAAVYLHGEDHAFTASTPTALAGTGNTLTIGDVNNDGHEDLVVLTDATKQMRILSGDGAGGFVDTFATNIGAGARAIALADLNHNGTLDLYSGGNNASALSILDNLGDGTFPPSKGFAMGNYYLTLNIDNQRAHDPDPVDQLAELFNEWEAFKSGLVDATRSTVHAPSRIERGQSFEIEVRLFDRSDKPIDGSLVAIEAIGEGGLITLTGTKPINDHTIALSMAAGEAAGDEVLVIRALQGTQSVRLMPDTRIRVLESIADFNADGVLDLFDVFAFLHALNTGDLGADLDGSGTLDGDDVMAFVQRFLEN